MSKRKAKQTSAVSTPRTSKNSQYSMPSTQVDLIKSGESEDDALLSKKQQFLWEWAMHEDHMYLNRSNFFFVGESMMVAGYAALKSSTLPEAQAKVVPICVLGLGISLLWLIVNVLHINQTAKPIKEELRRIELTTWLKIEVRRFRRIRITFIIGYILPLIFCLAWAYFMRL